MPASRLLRAFALALCGTPLFAACGADDEIERRIDCGSICGRYAECFDESYDIDECESRCRDEAARDEDYQDKVSACESCMDDESCAASLFECTDECLGIVP